jgi:hypothetical protein
VEDVAALNNNMRDVEYINQRVAAALGIELYVYYMHYMCV